MAQSKYVLDYHAAYHVARHLPGNLPQKFALWYVNDGAWTVVNEGFANPRAALNYWWREVTPECFTIEVHGKMWARCPEVFDYAAERGVSLEEAIIELANSGLSHLNSVVVQ